MTDSDSGGMRALGANLAGGGDGSEPGPVYRVFPARTVWQPGFRKTAPLPLDARASRGCRESRR